MPSDLSYGLNVGKRMVKRKIARQRHAPKDALRLLERNTTALTSFSSTKAQSSSTKSPTSSKAPSTTVSTKAPSSTKSPSFSTKAPSSTKPPSSIVSSVGPSLTPTFKSTVRDIECSLNLRLAYPHGEGYYDDDGLLPGFTGEALSYGFHKNYMTITDGIETCAGEDRQTPSWCEYKHTWDTFEGEDGFDPKDYYGAQHYYATQSQMY